MASGDDAAQKVEDAVREVEVLALRHVVRHEFGRAGPADLHAAIEIGLGARHGVEPGRLEHGAVREDARIGAEDHGSAAAIVDRAQALQLRHRRAARIVLGPEFPVARDFDTQVLRQRVDHRNADTMQAPRGLVDLVGEFAARMQCRQNHLERRLVAEFRVRIDRNAAAVVGNRQRAIGGERHLDTIGVACDGLVHGVVEHFGGEMVQCPFVGAADIHAGAPAYRLEPFENLDIARRIARLRRFGEQVAIRSAAVRSVVDRVAFRSCHDESVPA